MCTHHDHSSSGIEGQGQSSEVKMRSVRLRVRAVLVYLLMVWFSGIVVVRINEVALHRTRLVLGLSLIHI